MNLIEKLDNFLQKTKDGREVQKILAAKLVIQEKYHKEVEKLLNPLTAFGVSIWDNMKIVSHVE